MSVFLLIPSWGLFFFFRSFDCSLIFRIWVVFDVRILVFLKWVGVIWGNFEDFQVGYE